MVERGWRWCNRCQSLWLPVKGGTDHCPAGGAHSAAMSGDYIALRWVDGATWPRDNPQNEWRLCKGCRCLVYGSGPNACAATGGGHAYLYEYRVPMSRSVAGQQDWNWCNKCGTMVYGAHAGGVCAAGGQHDPSGSGYTTSFAGPKLSFIPARDGFHFANTAFVNQPAPIVPGLQGRGRCGGMACAAIDYWRYGMTVPTHIPSDFAPDSVPQSGRLGNYILDRLKNTLWNASTVQFLLTSPELYDDAPARSLRESFPRLKGGDRRWPAAGNRPLERRLGQPRRPSDPCLRVRGRAEAALRLRQRAARRGADTRNRRLVRADPQRAG